MRVARLGNGGEETQKNTKERFRFLSIFHRFFAPKSTLERFPARISEKTPKLDGKFLFFEAPEKFLALRMYLVDFFWLEKVTFWVSRKRSKKRSKNETAGRARTAQCAGSAGGKEG